jgi:hypothetical protein
MKALIFSLLLAASLVSGCAKPGPIGSFAGPLPEKPAVAAIADDAASILTGLYPPGHTTIRLLPARDAENGFAVALENGLRAKGVTLAALEASDALTLAYTLDMLEDKAAWYLQLRLSDGKSIARAYTASGQPEAGQSRTEQEFRRPVVEQARQKVRHAWDSGMDALK